MFQSQPTLTNRVGGFTLIEVLLSMALLSTLFALGGTAFQSIETLNETEIASSLIVQNLHQAQVYARTQTNDSNWGAQIQATQVVLFKGTSYAARDTSFDLNTSLPNTFVITGITEIVFTKTTGAPNTTGTTTITRGSNSDTITINAKGTLDY